MSRHALRMLVAALAVTGALGCEGPKNEGKAGSFRVESRLPSEGSALGSGNLTVATERAVEGIIHAAHFQPHADGGTVVVMDRVENLTSDPSADFQIYLARIRALLNQSGGHHGLLFVETRSKAEAIRRREGYPNEASFRQMPDYALTATFHDMPRGSTNYHLLTFQMVDLNDDVIVWEGHYEVKL